ncbi:MAG: nucleotide-diphospho-sugar transferase, partial [Chloroflexota bacterium]
LVFNRPETTGAVISSLRAVRPSALYVAADGPRPGIEGEAMRCAEARRIATSVDWECEVRTLFRDRNLGCALAVSSAVTWFFDNVTEGIILEDDCVPSRSFYRFCQELLEHYRENARVMHLAGNSYQYGRRRGSASYYFSRYPGIWGWASWRRAWQHYDFSLRPSWELQDTWDTQWQLSIQRSNGLAIAPNVNMVRNIGFGPGATHTKGGERPALLEADEVPFPLTHPAGLTANRAADTFSYYAHFRMVRFLNFIWIYRLIDLLYFRLKAFKGMMLGTKRDGR